MQSWRLLLPLCLFSILPVHASAQAVISARSGVVHFSEGAVFLDDQPLDQKAATFPVIKEGSTLRTAKGRAEILLTPGVILRLDENSGIRMRSASLADTRVEFLAGCLLLDSLDSLDSTHVLVTVKDSQVRFPKPGVYRLDFDTATLESYSGEAEVTHDGKKSLIDDSHLFFLTLDLTTKKLDATDDEFYDWARDRSNEITADNQLALQGPDDPADPDDADGDALAGLPPALGLQSPGVPPLGPIFPSSPAPSYSYPLWSDLVNPFSPYGVAFPYNPFPVFPVFVVVRPYGSLYHRIWPRPTTTPGSIQTWRTTFSSTVPSLPYTAFHPLPSTTVRPIYARPGAGPRPVVSAPRLGSAPVAAHAAGHR